MAVTLRDGSETADPRLDRIPHMDPRSRAYPARPLTAGRKPRSYTWRCPVRLNQGAEGACVGYGWAHELAARPAEADVDGRYARETIYWEAQRIDPWEGGSYPGASPRYEGTSVLAGAKVVQQAGWIAEYRWCFGVDDVVSTLGYVGPVVLGVDWHEGMYAPDGDGMIRPTGAVLGGHCIVADQVNVKAGYVGLLNSWGSEWGEGGRCRITIDDLGRLLSAGGEACVAVGRRTRP